MTHTEYSWMTSEELVTFVANKKEPSTLEVELAQRLEFFLNEQHVQKNDS